MPYLVDAVEAARSRARQARQEYSRLKRRKKIAAAKAAAKAIAQAKAGEKPKHSKPKPKPIYNNEPPKYHPGMKQEFYLTREWRKVRYEAIKKYGRICACCGSKAFPLHVDHVKPRSKYPSLELELGNLQVLCADCNLGKSNTDQTDWRGA